MTARTDLENAFSILDAGITAHVAALQASKAAHAVSQAAANDDTYLQALTTKVLSWADQLAASNPTATSVDVVAPVVAASVADAPAPLPALTPVGLTPAQQQAAMIAQSLPQPVVPVLVPSAAPEVAPASPVAVSPAHVPSVFETMQAAVAAMTKNI